MTYRSNILETGFAALVGILIIPAMFWGLITWNFKNAENIYMAEVNIISKPIFAAFENMLTAPLNHSKA
jgi:hypothetical protein